MIILCWNPWKYNNNYEWGTIEESLMTTLPVYKDALDRHRINAYKTLPFLFS